MERTRVLMTADAVGGVWEYALELGRGLRRAGVEVVLAVMGPSPTAPQAEAARLAGLEMALSPRRLEWMEDPWDDVDAAGAWLLELERRHRCTLVHLNGYSHGALPFEAPKVVVGHSCVASWWQAVRGTQAPPSLDEYRRHVSAGLAGADRVVAPTAWMGAALQRHYSPSTAIEVIHNGRDPKVFAPGVKAPFVLCAGRLWDEAKNAGALARVAGRLPWPVRIAGATRSDDGSNDVTLDGAQRLGVLSQPHLAALYGQAAIYASPARYEPFGLTVLEAGLSGCALVLSDLPTFRELWRQAAIFVPVDDEASLEAALRALIADEPRRRDLARRARQRALHYTATRMVRRYLTLYQDVTRREEAPPCAS